MSYETSKSLVDEFVCDLKHMLWLPQRLDLKPTGRIDPVFFFTTKLKQNIVVKICRVFVGEPWDLGCSCSFSFIVPAVSQQSHLTLQHRSCLLFSLILIKKGRQSGALRGRKAEGKLLKKNHKAMAFGGWPIWGHLDAQLVAN